MQVLKEPRMALNVTVANLTKPQSMTSFSQRDFRNRKKKKVDSLFTLM